jgi:A/G-specific adenine glycosylase
LSLPADFATRVLGWQARHGRHDLPWQNTQDPYRVWLSEIMLQQTQVATVRDYFVRFLNRFPDVQSLAAASDDEVLALWSGLGYYSRARNLHACARQVLARHGGAFPASAQLLQTLPGIGRSTAGAIAALCFGQRVAILDGNVKRVLTRFLGFEADLARTPHERQLWDKASELLPTGDLIATMPRYTQGMMDLGATVCLARSPQCGQCPVQADCKARQQGCPERYPVKTRKIKRTAQSIWMLWAQAAPSDCADGGAVLLQKRPTPGVWAGLYCFALFDSFAELAQCVPPAYRSALREQTVFKHVLTHKDLHLHPVQITLPAAALAGLAGEWFRRDQWPALGLPAPVRKLLDD